MDTKITKSLHSSLPNNLALSSLTDREWLVLLSLTYDRPNLLLATELNLTRKSFTNYKNRIGNKLQINGRDSLNRFARNYSSEVRKWYIIFNGNSDLKYVFDL